LVISLDLELTQDGFIAVQSAAMVFGIPDDQTPGGMLGGYNASDCSLIRLASRRRLGKRLPHQPVRREASPTTSSPSAATVADSSQYGKKSAPRRGPQNRTAASGWRKTNRFCWRGGGRPGAKQHIVIAATSSSFR